MKILFWAVVAAQAALFAGCYSKHLILQAEAVSMTKTDSGAVKQLKVGPEIEEKWCTSDKPVLANKDEDDELYGMADQVIYKAQGGGSHADFITDVRIYGDSDGCALLSGKRASL
jgi:hypothetical protein